MLVGSLLWLVTQQTRALRKLKSAERAREMAVQLAKLDGAGSGMRLLAALRAVYSDKPLILGKLNAAALALQPHHSDRDVIELLNREIFTAMDQQADQQIQKAALRAAFGVSSCPHPALDAVVVLVLSVMLIRDLMVIYGQFEPQVDRGKYNFVQERVKQGDKWRIQCLRLYVIPEE